MYESVLDHFTPWHRLKSTLSYEFWCIANNAKRNEGLGFYTDNEDTTLTPQDGNSFAGMQFH